MTVAKVPDEIDLAVESDENDSDEGESIKSRSSSHEDDSVNEKESSDEPEQNNVSQPQERRVGKPPVSAQEPGSDEDASDEVEDEDDDDEESETDEAMEIDLEQLDDEEDADSASDIYSDEGSSIASDEEKGTLSMAIELGGTDTDEESIADTGTHESRIVQNQWDDLDYPLEPTGISRETLESNVFDEYELAMRAWSHGRMDEAFRRFLELTKNPMLKDQEVKDFRTFDWPKAKREYKPTQLTKIRQYFFAVHKNLARFLKDPTRHYLQALSVKPTDLKLWFEFGLESAKRLNLNASEFAFKHYGDNLKSWEVLLKAHFCAKKYDKCLSYIQKIIFHHPQHILAQVIKSEIRKISEFWSRIIDGFFPEPGFGLGPPSKKEKTDKKHYANVLLELDEWSHKAKTYISSPERTPTAVAVRLDPSTSFQDLAVLLCDLFDRIEAFSSFHLQRVNFLRERQKKPRPATSRLSTNSSLPVIPESPTHELTVGIPDSLIADPQPVSLKNLQLAKTSLALESEVFECMEDVVDVWSCLEAVVDKVVEDEAEKSNRPQKNPRKRALKPVDEKESRPDVTEKTKTTRKSTRLLDEILDNVVNYDRPQRKKWKIDDYMGLPKHDDESKTLPHEFRRGFPLTRKHKRPAIPQKLSDETDFPEISVQSLVQRMLDDPRRGWAIEELMFEFCKHVAVDYEAEFRLKEEQRTVFRQLYARWINAFCIPASLPYTDVARLAIHTLAAEVGSPCARDVLAGILNTPKAIDLLIERICLKGPTQVRPNNRPNLADELRKSKAIIAAQKAKELNATLDDVEDSENPEMTGKLNVEQLLNDFRDSRRSRPVPTPYEVLKSLGEKIQREQKECEDGSLDMEI